MGYALTSPVLGKRFTHPLTDEEFAIIERSRDFILEYSSFEETILQTIFALQDFEEYILRSALHEHLFPIGWYDFEEDMRLRGNLRVNALLNSVASIKDQFPKFQKVPELRLLRDDFLKQWHEARSTSVAFNFFERLLNHAQHATQPVSLVVAGGGWDNKRCQAETRFSVYVDVDAVCSHRGIGKEEADRYRDHFGKSADISLIFRETLGMIGTIAKDVRRRTEKTFDLCSRDLRKYIAIGETYRPDSNLTHSNVSFVDGNKTRKIFELFPELLSRASRLRGMFLMENNARHFVSNRAYGHRPAKPS